MNTINGMDQGDLDIDEDTHISGMVTGNVTVLNGHAVIGGTVRGRVTAQGGTVTVRGSVAGPLQGDPTAIRIAEGAVVNGQTLTPNGTWTEHTGTTTVYDHTPTHILADVGHP